MIRALLASVAVLVAACPAPRRLDGPSAGGRLPDAPPGQLRAPEAFEAAFPERAARSRALFVEASRVLLHPRCANCHPDGDSPLQGAPARLHDPPVRRGPEDRGIVGLECTSCHQDHNLELARVPGAPAWHLAPRHMAWVSTARAPSTWRR